VVRHSRPERCLPPFDDRGDNEGPERPELCLSQLARIFGKFLASGFLSKGTAIGKSENDRINTGDLWWAWVDLNHRPRPYQNCGHWSRAKNLRLSPSLVEPPFASAASQTKSLSRSAHLELRRMRDTNGSKTASITIPTTRFATYLVQPAMDLVFRRPTTRNQVRACSTFRAGSFQLGLTKWQV
jgi:hypothetical protein